MTGMEHTIEQAAALFDFTDEEWRTYQSIPDQGYSHRDWLNNRMRQKVETLAEAGLLAPAPLTEIRAENQFGETHRRWATDWELVDRAEGDGRADCGCAYCHAIHHTNPCNGKADESGGKAANHE